MLPNGKGCIRLGKVAGITLFLHWSWFLVAVLAINLRGKVYPSLAWNVAEYLALFGIVLLHRVRARLRLPANRRHGREDRALAAGRHRIRQSAAPGPAPALEHRGGPLGQCPAAADHIGLCLLVSPGSLAAAFLPPKDFCLR